MIAKIGVMTLILCTFAGIINACVTINTQNDTYTVDQSGCVQ